MKSFFKATIVIAVVSCVISLILTLGKPDFYGEVEVVSVSQTFGSNETNLVVKDRATSEKVDVIGNFNSEFLEGDVASLYVDDNLTWLWPGHNSKEEFRWARFVYWFGFSFFVLLWCLFFYLLINRLFKALIVLINAKFKTAKCRIIKSYYPEGSDGKKFYYVENLSSECQVMLTELEINESKVKLTIKEKNWHPVKKICDFEKRCHERPEEGKMVLAIRFGSVWMFSSDNISLRKCVINFRKSLWLMLLTDLLLFVAGVVLLFLFIF